eukprot:2102415-Prymnesium_polylepis.1
MAWSTPYGPSMYAHLRSACSPSLIFDLASAASSTCWMPARSKSSHAGTIESTFILQRWRSPLAVR